MDAYYKALRNQPGKPSHEEIAKKLKNKQEIRVEIRINLKQNTHNKKGKITEIVDVNGVNYYKVSTDDYQTVLVTYNQII